VVGIDDIVDEKWQCPRGVILTTFSRFILRRFQFYCYCGKVYPFIRASCRESNITAAAKIDSVFFKNFGGTKIGSDNLTDGYSRGISMRGFLHGFILLEV
jgi:hypothetical protein